MLIAVCDGCGKELPVNLEKTLDHDSMPNEVPERFSLTFKRDFGCRIPEDGKQNHYICCSDECRRLIDGDKQYGILRSLEEVKSGTFPTKS
jgi:hypothetical protein